MTLKAFARIQNFGMYNCAMGIFSNLTVTDAQGNYVKPEYLIEHKDEIIKDFLEYMNCPTMAKVLPAKEIPGVIAHYVGHKGYTKLAFWVFHDNVLGDRKNPNNPFTDTSALMAYLFHNQNKYGCTIVRTHMADNVYHQNNCSNPGRVYVLTPPAIQVLDHGVKMTGNSSGISVALRDAPSMYPDDVGILESCLSSKRKCA